MTTTPSLPDLYARVVKVCQGIRILNLYPPTWEGGLWSIDSAGGTSPSISTSMAESLLLASCVRWLADKGLKPMVFTSASGPQYIMTITQNPDDDLCVWFRDDSLTIAALLAVEAVCKERGNA